MKTVLAVIGGLAIIIVIAIVSLVAIGFQQIGPLVDEAQAYADETIPAIATDWDAREFNKRASPELKALLKTGGVNQLMSTAERMLGEMTAYTNATCELTGYEYRTGDGELAQASCKATATHEKGEAAYVLNLLKRKDEWKVLGFFVTQETNERGPVQVRFEQTQPQLMRRLHFSVEDKSIGVSASTTPATGAGINLSSKIDNTPQ